MSEKKVVDKVVDLAAAQENFRHEVKERKIKAIQQRFSEYLPEKKLTRQQRRLKLRLKKK